MTTTIKQDIDYIKNLMSNHTTQQDPLSPQEKTRIKELTKEFISRHNLLLYGGVAINALLPEKDRFYTEDANELNDFDLLSPAAKKHAKMMADMFYSNGFLYTEVKPAIHDGTFKVFVNFTHVADITSVTETFFVEMVKLSQKERSKHNFLDKSIPKLNIAPVYLLKYFIITELTRPQSSLFRWEKVYNRMTQFYRYYSSQYGENMFTPKKESGTPSPKTFKTPLKSVSLPEEIHNIYYKTLDVIKSNKWPIIGNLALGIYLGKNIKSDRQFMFECCRIDEFFSVFEILSAQPQKTFEALKSHLDTVLPTNYKIITQFRSFYGEIIPKRIRVYIELPNKKQLSLLTIVETDHCYAVTTKEDYTIGTPYTILNFMYAYWLVYYVYENKQITNAMNRIIKALEEYIYKESTIEERFRVECYGKEKSILDVKKEHFNDPSHKFIYHPADKHLKKNELKK